MYIFQWPLETCSTAGDRDALGSGFPQGLLQDPPTALSRGIQTDLVGAQPGRGQEHPGRQVLPILRSCSHQSRTGLCLVSRCLVSMSMFIFH